MFCSRLRPLQIGISGNVERGGVMALPAKSVGIGPRIEIGRQPCPGKSLPDRGRLLSGMSTIMSGDQAALLSALLMPACSG